MAGLGNNYLRVTLNFLDAPTGAKCTSALYYKKTAGADPVFANIVSIADAFRTAYLTAVPPSLSDSCQVTHLQLDWKGAGTEVQGNSSAGPIVGAVSGESTLPEEVVAEIQRRTGLQGRNKRGRVFWPFVPESFNEEGGEISTGGLAAYGGVAEMIASNVTAIGTEWIPQTPDYKTGSLTAVIQTRVCTSLLSRRDRRFVKKLSYQ